MNNFVSERASKEPTRVPQPSPAITPRIRACQPPRNPPGSQIETPISLAPFTLDHLWRQVADLKMGMSGLDGKIRPGVLEQLALTLHLIPQLSAGIGRGHHEVRQLGIEFERESG